MRTVCEPGAMTQPVYHSIQAARDAINGEHGDAIGPSVAAGWLPKSAGRDAHIEAPPLRARRM
jgi:hypothetical protein